MVKNTSYKVQVDVDSDEVRNAYQIEEGAYVTTSSGVYTVWNGEWVKLYPQGGASSGLGWVRYDDTQYTSSNKLALVDGVQVNLPNNGGNTYRSHDGVDYYNPATNKLIGDNLNDTYILTVTFKASSPNANQTHLDFQLVGNDYSRVANSLGYFKGNDVTQNFHRLYQYYVDADFVSDGVGIKITSDGGSSVLWDVIFFIQKVQNYG